MFIPSAAGDASLADGVLGAPGGNAGASHVGAGVDAGVASCARAAELAPKVIESTATNVQAVVLMRRAKGKRLSE